MKTLPLLGGLTPAQFLRDHWHKKPLLVRQAIPGFQPPLRPKELFALAARDEVESRLVSHGKQWEMRSGPFETLPPPERDGWTLLVQGANLHDEAADLLLRLFRFIPDARLDDLMVSYASNGGGVGPHYDSYDVFLLQAHGQRRWRIGAQQDLTLVEGLPLKILRNFTPEQEFILEPGDMLYLPPQYAHDGIAIGECMTCSIGFHAPAFQELGEAFLQFMADSIELPGLYQDPGLQATKHPAEIGAAMLRQIGAELRKVRFTPDDIAIFLGERLSEPKHNVFFETPPKPLTFARFCQTVARRGAALSRKSRMLYQGSHVFINGESFSASKADMVPLAVLANERKLPATHFGDCTKDVLEALYAWYQDGWLTLE